MRPFPKARLLPGLLALPSVLLSSVAVAYPINTPLADLVDSQEPGTWLRVNQNQFRNVWTPTAQRSSPGAGSPRYVISAWSGGGYDTNTGDFYVWGGDNGTYSGNEVYRWTASTLNWERLSLPSAITYSYTASGKKLWHTVDGTDHAPISGETFDNVVFLPNVNRLAIIGGNAYPGGGKQYYREDGVTRAGPFFFDPTKGSPNKVGGTTGSHVNPAAFPNVVGGNMWENRQSIHTDAGIVGPRYLQGGVSAVTTIDGKDVVFAAEQGKGGYGRLFQYTVNSLDAAEDQWKLVGVMGKSTYSGTGVGAYDPTRNIFMRTAAKNGMSLMYWDLSKAGPTNSIVYIHPDSLLGDYLPLTGKFGMDYDPVSDAYYLWAGTGELWKLLPPAQLGPTGWKVERIFPQAVGPTLAGSYFSGVYGKWNYMEGLGAFMGVIHDLTGDVWIYKPISSDFSLDAQSLDSLLLTAQGDQNFDVFSAETEAPPPDEVFITPLSVPEPGTLALLALWTLGVGGVGIFRRKRADQK